MAESAAALEASSNTLSIGHRALTLTELSSELDAFVGPNELHTLKLSFVDCGDDCIEIIQRHLNQHQVATNPVLTSLTLQACGLTPKCIPKLCTLLDSLTNIHTLCIGDNKFTDEGVDKIGATVSRLTRLTYLNFGGNKVSDGSIEALAAATASLPLLRVLSFRGTGIGKLSFDRLASLNSLRSLEQFQLRSVQIDEAKATSLARLVPMLESLRLIDVQRSNLTADVANVILEPLQRCSTLTTLSLSDNALGDGVAEHLRKILQLKTSCLVSLALRRSQMTANGLGAVAAGVALSTTLCAVDISASKFGSAGCIAFAPCLPLCRSLKSLCLAAVGAGPEGVRALCEALADAPHIQQLDFSSNFSDAEGCEAWCAFLSSDKFSLRKLVLTDNNIPEAHATALSHVIVKNLVLQNGNFGGQSSTPPLGNVVTLEQQRAICQQLAKNRLRAENAEKGIVDDTIEPTVIADPPVKVRKPSPEPPAPQAAKKARPQVPPRHAHGNQQQPGFMAPMLHNQMYIPSMQPPAMFPPQRHYSTGQQHVQSQTGPGGPPFPQPPPYVTGPRPGDQVPQAGWYQHPPMQISPPQAPQQHPTAPEGFVYKAYPHQLTPGATMPPSSMPATIEYQVVQQQPPSHITIEIPTSYVEQPPQNPGMHPFDPTASLPPPPQE